MACGAETVPTAIPEVAGDARIQVSGNLILVTDEDDGGSEDDRPPMPPVMEYVDFFNGLKGDAALFSLSVIAGDIPNGCSSSVADAAPGYRYGEIVAATGGTIESICQEDFGPVLQRLGSAISGFEDTFGVAHPPENDTLTVWVDGTIVTPGTVWNWDVASNSVVFNDGFVPEGCSTIRIEYWIPTRPGETDPVVITHDEEAFTCGAIETPTSVLGSHTLDGGSIAACNLTPELGMTPQRGAAAVAFLLALSVLGVWRRRRDTSERRN